MRIVVAAIGRLKQGPETELSERYRKRAAQTGRSLGLRDVEIVEIRESRSDDAGKRMIEESIALANVIPQGAAVVLLEPRGDNLDSNAIANQLAQWRGAGKPAAVFMIGGPDGLAAEPRRQGRPQARLRHRHLAAPTRPGDAAGTALPRHHNPVRTPLPSGMKGLRRMTRNFRHPARFGRNRQARTRFQIGLLSDDPGVTWLR